MRAVPVVSLLGLIPEGIDWGWQDQAACRDRPLELFFHEHNERGLTRTRRQAAAKRICNTCPVIEECRDFALAARIPYGTWGGQSEEERGFKPGGEEKLRLRS